MTTDYVSTRNSEQQKRKMIKQIIAESILLESRLTKAQEKYPSLTDFNWIGWDDLEEKDPSGNNKYLMWMAKQTDRLIKEIENGETEFAAGTSQHRKEDYYAHKIDLMYDLVDTFHDNIQKMENKDINSYETVEDLKKGVTDSLGAKEKTRREKEKKVEDSVVVYEDDRFFAVRPMTEEASCYFGRNTTWCIAATIARNYFNDYTEDDRIAFTIIRDNTKRTRHPLHHVALMVDENGAFEAQNAPNEEIGLDNLKLHLGADVYNEIVARSERL